MAQDSGFFNAEYQDGEYDRVYNAEQFAAYFAAFIGNGIFGGKLEELLPLANDPNNMSVNISSGRAWINGWWYTNDETLNMPIEVADGVLSRKDIIVVRWGVAERSVWLQVVKGEPSYQPQAPEIRRDADYFDLKLCEIDIPAGTSKITQSQITDTRLDNTVCGLVTGVVDQIDTTSLYLQFRSQFGDFMEVNEEEYTEWYTGMQAAFTTWMNDEKADFDEWYAYIQTIIDESAVLHLQSEIDALDELEYTSSDVLNPTSSESVDLLQSGETAVSRWQKVSKMFKNIRYILSQIGNTSISSIGDTITLAISNLSNALNNRGTNTYGTCTTAADVAAKVVSITNTNWKFKIGSRVTVKFTYTNTAQNPTLNVNGTGAKSIWYNTGVLTTGSLGMAGTANRPMEFMYDGTYWVFVGWSVDNNTTYSVMSQSELETGTATNSRVVRSDYLKAAIQTIAKALVVNNLTSTSTNVPLSAAQGKALNDSKQDKLTNPLTKSDVVNNLTTTTTNVPLSAAQGKVLNDNKVSKNSVADLNAIELKAATPFIDFHFNNSTADHTSRIIESASGLLEFMQNVKIDGSLTYSPNTYRKRNTNVSASNGWGYYGDGISLPAGSYIINFKIKGSQDARILSMGLSYEDGYWISLGYNSYGRIYTGEYTYFAKYTTTTLVKPCIYSDGANTIAELIVTAMKVG